MGTDEPLAPATRCILPASCASPPLLLVCECTLGGTKQSTLAVEGWTAPWPNLMSYCLSHFQFWPTSSSLLALILNSPHRPLLYLYSHALTPALSNRLLIVLMFTATPSFNVTLHS